MRTVKAKLVKAGFRPFFRDEIENGQRVLIHRWPTDNEIDRMMREDEIGMEQCMRHLVGHRGLVGQTQHAEFAIKVTLPPGIHPSLGEWADWWLPWPCLTILEVNPRTKS